MNVNKLSKLSGLYKPTADAIAGKVNWKEFGLCIAFAALIGLSGGQLDVFLKNVFDAIGINDPVLVDHLDAAIVGLITAYLHRKEQKA